MTSLATCIRKAGKALNRDDAAAIREIMAEGGTAQQAVDEYLSVLADEKAALIAEIQEQGGAQTASLEETRQLARTAHAGQLDYEGKDYFPHVERVGNSGRNLEEKLVGYLHDIVEDTDVTLENLRGDYSDTVIKAIEDLTWAEEAGEPYETYLARVFANPLASAVKFFDTRDNMRLTGVDTLTGDPVPNAGMMERRTYDAMVRAWNAMEGDKPPLPGPQIMIQAGQGDVWDKYWISVWNNVKAISRTLSGKTDAAGSATKAAAFAATGAEAARLSEINLQKAWDFVKKHQSIRGPNDLLEVINELSNIITGGVVAEGKQFREHDVKDKDGSLRHIPVGEIQGALEQFSKDLYGMMETAQPAELLAFIHRRFNHEIHPYTDGVGKTTEILADWMMVLRRDPLPTMPSFKAYYKAVSRTKGDLPAFTEFMRSITPSRVQAVNNHLAFREWLAGLSPNLRQGYADLLADKTHINDLKIEFMLLEDEVQAEAQLEFAKLVMDTDIATIRDWYAKLDGPVEKTDGGRIQNVDAYREYFKLYRDERGKFSVATHEVSSALAKDSFRILVNIPAGPGDRDLVLILAGGSGSGKSTALNQNGSRRAKVVLDAVMGKVGPAVKKIHQALNAGNRVDYMYVYRDPIESWEGVVFRALKQGRTVSLDRHLYNHSGARETAETAISMFSDNGAFRPELWYNRTNKDDSDWVESFDDLPQQESFDTLIAKGLQYLQDVRNTGGVKDKYGKFYPISEATYRALLPSSYSAGVAGREGQDGSSTEGTGPRGTGRGRAAEVSGQSQVYSRTEPNPNPAVRSAELQLALAPAIRALVGTAQVHVVQSTRDLPDIRDDNGNLIAAPTDVEGLYRGGDEFWLVADNLPNAARAKKVFAHEGFGHLAMERMPEFHNVLASVKNMLAINNKTFTDVAAAVATTQNKLTETQQLKEILAYMAEHNMENGVIASAYAAVRSTLRNWGLLDGANYSEAEIKALLVRAARDLVSDAAAKQKALAAMPAQQQILEDPDAVEQTIALAIQEIYANAALQELTMKTYSEITDLEGNMDPAAQERLKELKAAMYHAGTAPGVAPDVMDPEAMYSRAYHGTGATGFTQFDLRYMGSGEGAQAFGWGLYFTDSRGVAEWYQRKLSGGLTYNYGEMNGVNGETARMAIAGDLALETGRVIEDEDIADNVANEVAAAALGMFNRHNGSNAAVSAELAQQGANYKRKAEVAQRMWDDDVANNRDIDWGKRGAAAIIQHDIATAEAYDRAIELVTQRLTADKRAGNLMEVEIPDNDDLLHYEDTINEHSPEVIAKIKQHFPELFEAQWTDTVTGEPIPQEYIDTLRNGGSVDIDQKASGRGWQRVGTAIAKTSDDLEALGFVKDVPAENMTGDQFYRFVGSKLMEQSTPGILNALTNVFSGTSAAIGGMARDRMASEFIRDTVGIPGHSFIGGTSSALNYVIYDDAQIQTKAINDVEVQAEQLFSRVANQFMQIKPQQLRQMPQLAASEQLPKGETPAMYWKIASEAGTRAFNQPKGSWEERYYAELGRRASAAAKTAKQQPPSPTEQIELFSRGKITRREFLVMSGAAAITAAMPVPLPSDTAASAEAIAAAKATLDAMAAADETRKWVARFTINDELYQVTSWDRGDDMSRSVIRKFIDPNNLDAGTTAVTEQTYIGQTIDSIVPQAMDTTSFIIAEEPRVAAREKLQSQTTGYLERDERAGEVNDDGVRFNTTGNKISDRAMYSRKIHSNPEIERIRDKVLTPALEDITIKDRVRGLVERIKAIEWLGIKQGIVDDIASLGALERGIFDGNLLDASTSPYKAVLATRNLGSVMAAIMHRGIPIYQNGVFTARTGRKGLIDIFQKITHHKDGNLLPLWELYAVAKRSQRLIQEKNSDGTSKEKVLTQQEINTAMTLEIEYPEFKEVHAEWQAFNSQLLDLAIKRGVINGHEAKVWRQNDYVPFYRAMEEIEYQGGQAPQVHGEGVANVRSGIKRLTGSEAKIGNVFENMVQNTAYLTDAIYRNTAMQRVVLMADGIAMHKVPMAFEAVRFNDADLARALMKAGLIVGNGINEADMFNDGIRQVGAMTQAQKEHWSVLFRKVAPQGPNIISVLEQGKPVYYEVEDPLLLRALGAMGAQQWGGIMHTFRFAKRTLTKMVTIDPAFMMANFLRDTLSTAVVVKGSGTKQIAGAIKGLRDAFNEDPDIMAMMMAGAGGGGFYDHNPADVRKMLAKKMPAGEVGAFANSIITPRGAYRAWQKIGNASEQANRVALYKRIVAEGGTEAEAAYQARDVLNFTMTGDYAAMKFLVQTVPFLNARIQGLYRLGRGGKENPVGFAMKGAAITIATWALLLKNQDDDRYKELPEWDKDTYWHFYIGDEHLRLPKPFEVGAIFATIPERMVMLGTGDDNLDVTVQRLIRMAADTMAFNPTPQLFKPMVEQYANRNMFTGSPIVGQHHQGLSPEAQYDPWTSETMRELAKVLPGWGGSPKRLEAFARGYFGAVGMYMLSASDEVTRRAFGHPDRPTKGIRNWPVVTRFVRDQHPRTSKYSNQMYDMMNEADALYSTMNAYRKQGRIEEARGLMDEEGGKLKARAFLHSIAKQVRAINTQLKRVQYSDMAPDKKKAAVDKLNAAKRKAMSRVARVSDIF